ncbi:MAG: recombinase family protein [Firmicutes bacterium]|nr:recombinase family protein [Bacillota bacterium]
MKAIYARQSVDKKDSISIDTQVEFCKKELDYSDDYKVYSDKGYSGSNISRPAFQQMIHDVRNGIIDHIIVYRLDRISRSVLDFSNLMNVFNKHGTTFVSTQEKFDTKSPIGKAMLNIIMVFAQLERETIQMRIRDNYYSRAEKGMYPGGPAPFGFELDEKKENGLKTKYLKEDDDKALIVKNMFEWYGVECLTLGGIARRLNEKGVKGNNGAAWSSNRVSMLLRNPIYVRADNAVYKYYKDRGCMVTNGVYSFIGENGCYLYGKRNKNSRKYSTYEDHKLSLAPSGGIVDSYIFLSCQIKLDKNTQIDNSLWGTKSWLTGIVRCAECGRTAIVKDAVWMKNGERIKKSYLKCTGAMEENGCSCKRHLGNVKDIEEIVYKRIKDVIEKYKDVKIETSKKIGKEQKELEAKISDCDEKIFRLMDIALNCDEITSEYLNLKIRELHKMKDDCKKELDKYKADSADNEVYSIEGLVEQWDFFNNRQRKELVSFFINRIDVSKDKLIIYWKENFMFANFRS